MGSGAGRWAISARCLLPNFESPTLDPNLAVLGHNFRRKAKCWPGVEFALRDFSHSSLELGTIYEGWGILVKVGSV